MYISNRINKAFITAMVALVYLCIYPGCGGDDDGFTERDSGSIQVSPLRVAFSQVNLGESAEETVIIRNTDEGDLTLYELNFRARAGSSIDDLTLVEKPQTPVIISSGESLSFRVRYEPTKEEPNLGQLEFVSSDPRYSKDSPLVVEVDTLALRPQVDIQPPVVRFARMLPGQHDEQTVMIYNIGSAPLTIYEPPVYSGGNDFFIELPEREYPLELKIYDRDAAEQEPEAYGLEVKVVYAPEGESADSGEILIVTDDVREQHPSQDGRGISRVDIQANADAPCILVDGRTRNFGQVPIGGVGMDIVTVTNCGSQVLTVDNITLTENSSDNSFELDFGDWSGETSDSMSEPLSLNAGESNTFRIRYYPAQIGTDRGTVSIISNDPIQPELQLDLVARGSDGVCPVAEAFATIRGVSSAPRSNISAVPLQYIVLDGSTSFDEDGQVVQYEWEVLRRPEGALVQLGPTQEDINDSNPARREFRLLTAGTYEIGLRVIDNDNFHSCNQAVITVSAIPDQKVHIELTWTNPADPDESDSFGSDLDIHFVKMGPGAWFEAPYDIYFRNPNRGADDQSNGLWNPENPSLDIDVTTGAGPENITLDNPANCQWYAIGVHYYQEMFGTAYATVRIYINTNLVFERVNIPMTRGGQFWDVARIHWDADQAMIYDVDTIYPAPTAGQAPEVTQEMMGSGLCTTQELY